MTSVAYEDACRELVRLVPEFEPAYRENVEFYVEELPHIVMGEFTRFVERIMYADDDPDMVQRIFDAIEVLASSDDIKTQELVMVSFCEQLGKWDGRNVGKALPLMAEYPKTA